MLLSQMKCCYHLWITSVIGSEVDKDTFYIVTMTYPSGTKSSPLGYGKLGQAVPSNTQRDERQEQSF